MLARWLRPSNYVISLPTLDLNGHAPSRRLAVFFSLYFIQTASQVLTKTTTNRKRERIEGMRWLEFVPFCHSLSFLLGTEVARQSFSLNFFIFSHAMIVMKNANNFLRDDKFYLTRSRLAPYIIIIPAMRKATWFDAPAVNRQMPLDAAR